MNYFTNYFIDFLIYTKYFYYFNKFLLLFATNFLYYKINKQINNILLVFLYNSITQNGCVLIKIIQWLLHNYKILDESNIYIELFNNFYENCNIHSINYTEKILETELFYDFSNNIDIKYFDLNLDLSHNIYSGSIAQVYKGTLKNETVAVKIVHPEIDYQFLFPKLYLKIFYFITMHINCLKNYRIPFNINDFFDNMMLQINMNNEFKNLNYYYNNYKNNPYVVIPKPIFSSQNILIMNYEDGKKFNETDIKNDYEKYNIIFLFLMFIKEISLIKDYFHLDLHDANWKIRKYNDFYQIIIYDFGYVIDNSNSKNFIQNIEYACSLDDYNVLVNTIYDVLKTNVNESEFKTNLINYLKENNKYPLYFNVSHKNIVKYLLSNKLLLKKNMIEILISFYLNNKYVAKYIHEKEDYYEVNNNININDIISKKIEIINFCKKLNCFNELAEYIKKTYINNVTITKNYNYNNNNFDNLKSQASSINI